MAVKWKQERFLVGKFVLKRCKRLFDAHTKIVYAKFVSALEMEE